MEPPMFDGLRLVHWKPERRSDGILVQADIGSWAEIKRMADEHKKMEEMQATRSI